MVDLNTLFYLVLGAVFSITTGVITTIVYLMIEGEKKSKLKDQTSPAIKSRATQKCLHFIGYLADEHPKGQPIPEECFGCTLAMKCMNKQAKKRKVLTVPHQTVS